MPGRPLSAATIILRRRIDAGMTVDSKPLGVREQRLWPHAIAHSPAGHRIRLAPAVEQDHPLAQGWVLEKADMLCAVIDDLAIDLITHDGNLRMALKPGDEPVEFGARHHAAGRISRAVDDQQPGLRRYFFQHLVGAERKSLALIERHRYRRCAGKPDDALIDRKTGIRIENFGP